MEGLQKMYRGPDAERQKEKMKKKKKENWPLQI
jgi:hypothetical protein